MPSTDQTTDDVRLRGIRASAMVRGVYADAFAAKVGPVARRLRARGYSLTTIAAELNKRGIKTPRDRKWVPQTVRNLLVRDENLRAALD